MIEPMPFVSRPACLAEADFRSRQALRLLHEAWEAARAEGQDIWQFAVEIEQLRAIGLSHTELRRLLCRGYIEHAWERTSGRARQRVFQPLHTLILPKRTCFVLTAKGWDALRNPNPDRDEEGVAGPEAPHWDQDARQLWWHDCLIKVYHRPAVNQELILAALEEEGWPARIDDPLPQARHIDPKIRLHDTIKALNRHHLRRIIHFGGDGRGQGIQWIFTEPGASERLSSPPDLPRISP